MEKSERYRHHAGAGPSAKWIGFWLAVLWAAAAGYAAICQWLWGSFPPIFRHVSGFEFLLSVFASFIGIAIPLAAVVVAVHLYGLLATQRGSSVSADSTVQSQETES